VVHLFKVVDSNSSGTNFTQMPTMPELIATLNSIYAQTGIRWAAGDAVTLGSTELGHNYDTDLNGKLDGDSSDNPTEWNQLQDHLGSYLRQHYGEAALRVDFFAFVFKESAKPSGLTQNNQQPYFQRGGNLSGPGALGSGSRTYGPFIASVGTNSTEELAAGIGHEIGHTLNTPFFFASILGGLFDSDLVPPIDANESDNTSGGHDNFNFDNPDYVGQLEKRIWSIMRSGLYHGNVMQIDQWSRSLRKSFWEETNLRAQRRIDPMTNPPIPIP
jgi:hypothetical protein